MEPEPESAPRSAPRALERAVDDPITHDLPRRLQAVPPEAELRGVFFLMIEDALSHDPRLGRELARLHPRARRTYASHPVRDYLEALATAARLLGPTTTEGMRRCHARAAAFVLGSPLGRIFLRRADLEPTRLLGRLERSRALIANYGRWRVYGCAGDVTIEVRDEYVWLREAWVPAIASVFPALGLPPAEIDCELHGLFDGRIRVRW